MIFKLVIKVTYGVRWYAGFGLIDIPPYKLPIIIKTCVIRVDWRDLLLICMSRIMRPEYWAEKVDKSKELCN